MKTPDCVYAVGVWKELVTKICRLKNPQKFKENISGFY